MLLAVFISMTLWLLPFTNGHAISAGNVFYQAYLLVIASSFFLGFWFWGGQTPGMRAWRLKIIADNNRKPYLGQLLLRLLLAIPSIFCFGLGFFWLLWDTNRETLYDRGSRTRMVIM
jgi:uncharacterized RDD family membrane protein YckC